MKRSFIFCFLACFSSPALQACEPGYLMEDDNRTILLQMQNISRWYQSSLASDLEALVAKMDQETKGQPYTKTDLFSVISYITKSHPTLSPAIQDLFQMARVKTRGVACIPHDTSHVSQERYVLSPGFSHYYIDQIQQLALEASHRLAGASQELIQVADVGAGHGFATARFLLTGTSSASAPQENISLKGVRVTAIEAHTPLIKGATGSGPLMHIFKKTKELSPAYAQTGARVSDYLLIRHGDAATALAQPKCQNFFDLCYLGNMLHFNAPVNAQALVERLFFALKPGGNAYASVHTGLFFQNLFEDNSFHIYEQQCLSGKKFPGWMMINSMAPLTDKSVVGDYVDRQLWPLDEDKDTFSPVKKASGWHNAATKAGIAREEDGRSWAMGHQSLQIYDALSLKGLFERSGFQTLDLFFQDTDGKRIQISDLGRGDGRFANVHDTLRAPRVCIVAHKPDVSPPTPAPKG